MKLSTSAEVKYNIEQNISVSVHSFNSKVVAEFSYEPSDFITLPETGVIPHSIKLNYKDDMDYRFNESKALQSAVGMFLEYAVQEDSLRDFKYKRFGSFRISSTALKPNPADRKSFIRIGRVELSFDPTEKKIKKLSAMYDKRSRINPIIAVGVASKSPHIYSLLFKKQGQK